MGISLIGTDESVQEIDFFQKSEIRKISVIFLMKKSGPPVVFEKSGSFEKLAFELPRFHCNLAGMFLW